MIIDDNEYYRTFHTSTFIHHNLNSIMSLFNIGEVRKIEGWYNNELNTNIGYGFVFNNKLLWHEFNGIHKVNYDYVVNKLNK